MRLLAKVEDTNHSLNDDIEVARTVAENLRDYVSSLETQLSGMRTRFKCVISFIPENPISKIMKPVTASNIHKVTPNIVLD